MIFNFRGKCNVVHINSVKDAKEFEHKDDNFFCILGYNPETRRLASIQGDTKIGPSHQWTATMRGYFQKVLLYNVSAF